jgi:putative phage-type endonuclease
VKYIATGLFEEWSEDDLCEDYDLPEIQDWVKRIAAYYFATESDMPPRQGGEPLATTPLRRAAIAKKLRILENTPAPPQRTQEWYETRYGLLTASNVWKAIGTEAQQNQLITEKCVPFDKFKEDCARHGNLSADNPMAWGQKYEPVSALIYESKNRTKLGEYGCIVHPEWQFLGASPDGINIDPESPVYGRMVEIKNIVNRDIDGVPLDAYWVQIQTQLEVADLEECDFVETRIKEYATKEEFQESANPYKGAVATFVPRITIDSIIKRETPLDRKPFYEYLLLNQSSEYSEADEWIQSKKDANPDYVLSNVNYWGLDQYSCVLVKRNRAWFNAAIPQMERIWRTIERERITGCEHRAPKKREPKAVAQVVMVNKQEQEPHTPINNNEMQIE